MCALISLAPSCFKRVLGIVKFNLKPKKGVAYLREHGIIDETAESLARFLHTYEYNLLDKTTSGDFLGEPDEFAKQVRNAYIDMMDFRGYFFPDGMYGSETCLVETACVSNSTRVHTHTHRFHVLIASFMLALWFVCRYPSLVLWLPITGRGSEGGSHYGEICRQVLSGQSGRVQQC